MTSLVIMAAGIGSRFGGGIKQLEAVGANGEIIMDFSIHDAIEAGFNKIVFIIRRDIEKDFKEIIGERIEKICAEQNVAVAYAFQALDCVPGEVPEGRTKPWGTGQAVLAAKDVITESFAVINADDYYGKEAFVQMHDWLTKEHDENAIAMAGFILKNTLSDNGGVTRGVCKAASDNRLAEIVETKNIIKTDTGAEADGRSLDPESYVSMNFWGFPAKEGDKPAYLTTLEEGFEEFFRTDVVRDPLKSEYLLPTHIGGLLAGGKVSVEILPTNDKWFGVTYKEDKPDVVNNFKKLIADGVYKEKLFEDLQQ